MEPLSSNYYSNNNSHPYMQLDSQRELEFANSPTNHHLAYSPNQWENEYSGIFDCQINQDMLLKVGDTHMPYIQPPFWCLEEKNEKDLDKETLLENIEAVGKYQNLPEKHQENMDI